MYIIDYNNNKRYIRERNRHHRGVVEICKIADAYYFIYGYFIDDERTILMLNDRGQVVRGLHSQMSPDLVFSKKSGYYFIPLNKRDRVIDQYFKGFGDYPYTIVREYEAQKNLDRFKKRNVLIKESDFRLSKYLNYTFGVEFETSQGYVPQDICFRDGLIPLRDGSISGIEYSTIVLSGSRGLNLLRQQCETLSEYTEFNKNCALHIHLGGYPVTVRHIFALYKVLSFIQNEIAPYLPTWSFHTSNYKDNGKDYCLELPHFSSFNELYEYMSDGKTKFMNSLYQAHPSDVEHDRKWQIHARYHNFNFVNLLFYDSAKTLELRFLRPSFNFNKIYLWLCVFNAILNYAVRIADTVDISRLESDSYYFNDLLGIINGSYSEDQEFVDFIIEGLRKLYCVVSNQENNGDHIGANTQIEDKVFNSVL